MTIYKAIILQLKNKVAKKKKKLAFSLIGSEIFEQVVERGGRFDRKESGAGEWRCCAPNPGKEAAR